MRYKCRLYACGKEEPLGEIYGYIRVSTREQNEDRQRIALREIAVPEKNILWTNSQERTLSVPCIENWCAE